MVRQIHCVRPPAGKRTTEHGSKGRGRVSGYQYHPLAQFAGAASVDSDAEPTDPRLQLDADPTTWPRQDLEPSDAKRLEDLRATRAQDGPVLDTTLHPLERMAMAVVQRERMETTGGDAHVLSFLADQMTRRPGDPLAATRRRSLDLEALAYMALEALPPGQLAPEPVVGLGESDDDTNEFLRNELGARDESVSIARVPLQQVRVPINADDSSHRPTIDRQPPHELEQATTPLIRSTQTNAVSTPSDRMMGAFAVDAQRFVDELVTRPRPISPIPPSIDDLQSEPLGGGLFPFSETPDAGANHHPFADEPTPHSVGYAERVSRVFHPNDLNRCAEPPRVSARKAPTGPVLAAYRQSTGLTGPRQRSGRRISDVEASAHGQQPTGPLAPARVAQQPTGPQLPSRMRRRTRTYDDGLFAVQRVKRTGPQQPSKEAADAGRVAPRMTGPQPPVNPSAIVPSATNPRLIADLIERDCNEEVTFDTDRQVGEALCDKARTVAFRIQSKPGQLPIAEAILTDARSLHRTLEERIEKSERQSGSLHQQLVDAWLALHKALERVDAVEAPAPVVAPRRRRRRGHAVRTVKKKRKRFSRAAIGGLLLAGLCAFHTVQLLDARGGEAPARDQVPTSTTTEGLGVTTVNPKQSESDRPSVSVVSLKASAAGGLIAQAAMENEPETAVYRYAWFEDGRPIAVSSAHIREDQLRHGSSYQVEVTVSVSGMTSAGLRTAGLQYD